MGYKVYYDEMWAIIDKIRETNGKWNEQISKVSEKCEALNDPSLFKGAGASSISSYLTEVHGTLLSQLSVLLYELETRVHSYRYGYQATVDGGDGSDTGVRHTTIVQNEIEDGGEVCRNVNEMINLNASLRDDVNSVRRSIQDLISLAYPSSSDSLEEGLYNAKKIATDLNLKVLNYENEQRSCFDAVDSLISELKNIVHTQLSINRVPVASYTSGEITKMCNYGNLMVASQKVIDDIESLEDTYSKALELTFDRDTLIAAEEKAKREQTGKILKWVVIGVCAVASIAVTVATAGAATPLVLGAVGAATGVFSAGANNIIDQYVEKGDLRGNFDWSSFGKDVLIGGTVGFVTGAVGGAIGAGSTAGQTFGQKVVGSFATSIAGEVTEHTISTAWDVTEGIATGDIKDINGVLNEIESETKEMMGDIVKSGVSCIVDTALGDVVDLGEDKLFDKAKDGIGKSMGKVVYSTITDVATDIAGDPTKNVFNEGVDALIEGRDYNIDNVTDKFKESIKLENIGEELGKSFLNNAEGELQDYAEDKLIENYKYEDGKFIKDKDENRKFKAKMESKAGADGKVEMVQFENGTVVLKEDYDMAKYNAENYTELDKDVGYKRNRNAKEILGVRTTQGATVIRVDPESISKADYKGKSKVDKYIINPQKETK